jgi:hypothetical protein
MANFNVGKDAKSVNAHLKLSLRAGVKNKGLLLLLYLPFFFANNPSEV